MKVGTIFPRRIFIRRNMLESNFNKESTYKVNQDLIMPNTERIHLTFNKKIRQQLDFLMPLTKASSYAEVVRKGLDLLQKEIVNSNKS